MNISLAGRIALVTGGNTGIGRATSLALASAGADVAVNYVKNEDAAKEVVAEIEKMGRKAKAYHASVDDYDADAAMMEAIKADFGGLSILVNNAGIASSGKSIAKTPPEELRTILGIHAMAPYWLVQLALPMMREAERSDVIFISSGATTYLPARSSPYNMAKSAAEALAKTLAKEERHNGLRANIIAPGLTDTFLGRGFVKAGMGVENIHDLAGSMPFGHVCSPEEVANTIVALVSDMNTYVSGQKLTLDGGGN